MHLFLNPYFGEGRFWFKLFFADYLEKRWSKKGREWEYKTLS
jgi:hypothetical protein